MSDSPSTRPPRTKEERRAQYRVIEEMLDAAEPTLVVVVEHMRRHGLSRRQAFRDIRAVRLRTMRRTLAELGGQGQAVVTSIRRLDMLFNLAVEAKDWQAALRADDQRCRLLDLYPRGGRPAPHPPGTTATPATA